MDFLKKVEPAAQQRKCTESKQACEKAFIITAPMDNKRNIVGNVVRNIVIATP